jgi:hypothetical protein
MTYATEKNRQMQSHELTHEASAAIDAGAEEKPLTRREAAEFLTSKGFRISHATLSKLCSPAIDTGPKSCGKFGRDSMYRPSVLLAWAKNRMSAGCSGG